MRNEDHDDRVWLCWFGLGGVFADFGHDVICVDTDAGKIERLQKGEIPIYEPGLDELVAANARRNRLSFTTELGPAVRGAAAVFIARRHAVAARRRPRRSLLCLRRRQDIAEALDGFTVIVNKSTVPVGTGDEVERIIREARPDADFAVVSNPEFLREGAAIEDFKRPDRIVVGTEDPRAREVMAEIYRPLYLNQPPLMFTGRRTAELTKYAANAFLATKITFINEIADLCEEGRRRRAGRGARHRARQSHRHASSCTRARATAARAFPRTRWR